MSYADLNRRMNRLETTVPDTCPDCQDMPRIVILRGDDEEPTPCPVCGREPDKIILVRIGTREDGPQ